MDIKGIVPLYLQVGKFKVRTWFLVCPNLGAEAILGTSFIDRYIKAIYPGLNKVAFYRASSDSIIGSALVPEANRKRAVVCENTKSNKVRLSTAITIPPMTQIALSVHSQSPGLVTIQNHPETVLKHLTLTAHGVMDILPNRSFFVTISNFRDKPVRLPKGTVIGITLLAPVAIMEAQMDNLATPTPDEDVDSWEGRVAIRAALESYRPQHPYRTDLKGREIGADQIDKMRKAQVIEPAPPTQSQFPSPLVLVAKKDGSVRFYVDYRKLNAVTKRDSYPIPRMDDCLDSLSETVVFTTLEANSG
ncbi:unnamed protein product [Agarophyton chilense]